MQLQPFVTTLYTRVATMVDAPAWPDLQSAADYARHDTLAGDEASQLRASLPLLAALAVGGTVEPVLPIATSWELAYWAAAILDDAVDRDHPGRPWHSWPIERMLPVGVSLLLASQRCLAEQPAEVIATVTDALRHMTRGQANPPTVPTLEAYFDYITHKTGVYFAAYLWAGARTATSDPTVLKALYDYGMAIGLLAQVRDDNTWASVMADLSQGIYTLPVIFGLNQTAGATQDEMRQLMAAAVTRETEQVRLRERLLELGAPEYAERVATAFAAQAYTALAPLPAQQAAPLLNWLGKP